MSDQTPNPTPTANPTPATTPSPSQPPASSPSQELNSLREQVEQLRAQYQRDREQWETERAAWQAGITDPEGIEVARLLHNKLPQENRPAFGDWLSGAAKDPTKAPRALQAYFPAAAPAPQQPSGAPLPRSNAGTVPQPTGPAAPGKLSHDQVRAMREKAVRTGDWSEYRAIRDQLLRGDV